MKIIGILPIFTLFILSYTSSPIYLQHVTIMNLGNQDEVTDPTLNSGMNDTTGYSTEAGKTVDMVLLHAILVKDLSLQKWL